MVPLFEIPQKYVRFYKRRLQKTLEKLDGKRSYDIIRAILAGEPRAREFFRYHMEMCEVCGKMID